MDDSEFAKRSETISILAENFGRSNSVGWLKSFIAATESIPLNKFLEGARKATETCKFMPSPAEFRELAVGSPLLPSVAELNAADIARWKGMRH